MCKQKQFWSKYIRKHCLCIAYYFRVLSRFEFQVPHSKLFAILAVFTDFDEL